MPTELMKDFIGKVCQILSFDANHAETGRIVAVENNWIKVEKEKNKVILINGDTIGNIKIMNEKYQK